MWRDRRGGRKETLVEKELRATSGETESCQRETEKHSSICLVSGIDRTLDRTEDRPPILSFETGAAASRGPEANEQPAWS